jgi:phospholipid/cholesterol/gamma-HCH transport system substrate-binding protein
MKRTGKIKWGNMKVGILISLAIAAILYSSFSGTGVSIFAPRNHLVAYFENVGGLLKGASVMLSGVEVGNVKSVKFVNIDAQKRLEVRLSVKESVWGLITVDSKVQLGTIGLLGDRYAEIIPGTPGLPVIEPGGELGVLEEGGFDVIAQKSPQILTSLDSLVNNLNTVSKTMADGRGSVGKLISDTLFYDNLVAVLDRTSEVLGEIQRGQTKILDKLGTTLENTESITGKMDTGDGSLGRLVNDDGLYNNAARSAERLDSILARIDRGEGSAGALINDAELYEEMRNLIVRINNLVADIEENPRKYFKFSVF